MLLLVFVHDTCCWWCFIDCSSGLISVTFIAEKDGLECGRKQTCNCHFDTSHVSQTITGKTDNTFNDGVGRCWKPTVAFELTATYCCDSLKVPNLLAECLTWKVCMGCLKRRHDVLRQIRRHLCSRYRCETAMCGKKTHLFNIGSHWWSDLVRLLL